MASVRGRGAVRRLGAGIATAAAAAALAACGDTETPPEERVATTAEVLVDACERERPLVAMETLTEPAQAAFVEAPSTAAACEELLPTLLDVEDPLEPGPEALAALSEAEVEAASAEGGFGEAEVSSPAGRALLELELSPGGWLISGSG